MGPLLEKINTPADLKQLSPEQLKTLAQEIREFITQTVSRTGGHLASSLGVVELTLAMHYVFDFKKDRLLWDVGHQCYTHKIITGRKNQFAKLRHRNGVSGFPNPAESEYDQFTVGHAGTSIATALGLALRAADEKIVALVGDASIVNGLSFEAMNNLGLAKRQLLIVLNDNSMAIDVTQGAIAKFFAKVRLSHTYEDMRKTTSRILEHLPLIGKGMEEALEKLKKTLRMAISPSQLFESLNIPYFGPVDGHDIGSLIKLFSALAKLNHPAILHVYTKKGKGFTPAADAPRRFHSTGPFKINGDVIEVNSVGRRFTNAFGDALVELARNDERIIAITAAMPDGTGLNKFRAEFSDRYYDVGIAESVAVDIAAGLAKLGARPIVCIYSTFLQRSFDQIFQEVALQNLPVIFCIDRAGFVGSDGPTHQGLMDIGFLRMLPNMILLGPSNEIELKSALQFALQTTSPVAIRYPKATIPLTDQLEISAFTKPFELGKSLVIRETSDSDVAIVAYGSILPQAQKAAILLESEQIYVDLINARFAKPVDRDKIISMLKQGKTILTVEDHGAACGFGSAVLEELSRASLPPEVTLGKIMILAGPNEFLEHASRSEQLAEAKIDAQAIYSAVKAMMASAKNAD